MQNDNLETRTIAAVAFRKQKISQRQLDSVSTFVNTTRLFISALKNSDCEASRELISTALKKTSVAKALPGTVSITFLLALGGQTIWLSSRTESETISIGIYDQGFCAEILENKSSTN